MGGMRELTLGRCSALLLAQTWSGRAVLPASLLEGFQMTGTETLRNLGLLGMTSCTPNGERGRMIWGICGRERSVSSREGFAVEVVCEVNLGGW